MLDRRRHQSFYGKTYMFFMEKPKFVEIQIEILKKVTCAGDMQKARSNVWSKTLRKRKGLSDETPSLETLNLVFKISIRIRTIYQKNCGQTIDFNYLSPYTINYGISFRFFNVLNTVHDELLFTKAMSSGLCLFSQISYSSGLLWSFQVYT